MADKLMLIPNDENDSFCRIKLVVKTLELTNQNSPKSPKFLCQRIRKRYYKTLGTIVINSPLSSLSLITYVCKPVRGQGLDPIHFTTEI